MPKDTLFPDWVMPETDFSEHNAKVIQYFIHESYNYIFVNSIGVPVMNNRLNGK